MDPADGDAWIQRLLEHRADVAGQPSSVERRQITGQCPDRPTGASSPVDARQALAICVGAAALRPQSARARAARLSAPQRLSKRGIEELVELYGTEEAMILTTTYDHALRRRSYELIAEVFGLS